MRDFIGMMGAIFQFLKIELNIYGFVFSFWQIMLFSIILSIIFKFLGGILNE